MTGFSDFHLVTLDYRARIASCERDMKIWEGWSVAEFAQAQRQEAFKALIEHQLRGFSNARDAVPPTP